MQPLSTSTLSAASAQGVAIPSYDRADLTPGVVHLGLGAFHRAHQAMVFDTLLQGGDRRWAVLGVAMNSTAVADTLAAQDGLYAVRAAGREGVSWRVVGSIVRTCVAARERAQVVQAIAAPATRWITLTVTEKGYGPALAELLVAGLGARRSAGGAGLTIASCDNLSGNGRKLQALCLAQARRVDRALAQWIEQHCAFPDSMVDRIVPAATPERLRQAEQALGLGDAAALGTEVFWEWVIERRFADPADEQALAAAGVQVVDDVRPFEEAKLRMLNASHSAMACIGALAGLPTICDCASQPAVRSFVHGFMTQEAAPHVARPEPLAYRDALLQRFTNPDLRHGVHQIATDSSQKIPQRWVPVAEQRLLRGLDIEHLAFATAAWMRYLAGEDERGQAYALSDPLAAVLQPLARESSDDAIATVRALLGVREVWGTSLAVNAHWRARTAHWLRCIQQQGVLAALAEFEKDNTP